MIQPARTATLLAAHFPALRPELFPGAAPASVYQQLACFAAFTHRAAVAEALPLLRQCFVVADELLRLADVSLRAALANVYLYGLHLDGSTRGNALVRQLMPAPLYQLYARQHAGMLP